MNFRGKVKAIVSEAGVKKLTRQLHSRPRNISKAVDRLTQRDYKRTSGKARSGDRKAIKQLAQMHQQSTIQPVLYPKKSNPAPKRPLQALRADEQQSPDEKVKAIRAKAKAEGRELNDDERTEVVVQAGRKMRLKKSKPKAIRQPESQTENSSHAFYQKVKALSRGRKNNSLLEKKSKTIKLLIGRIKPCGEKSKTDEGFGSAIATGAIGSLIGGVGVEAARKWMMGRKKSKTTTPKEKSKTDESYESTRKWQPGDEPKQPGREPATTPASDKAFKKRQKKFLAGIKKTKKKK